VNYEKNVTDMNFQLCSLEKISPFILGSPTLLPSLSSVNSLSLSLSAFVLCVRMCVFTHFHLKKVFENDLTYRVLRDEKVTKTAR
jgi:hypothetical protein